MDSVIRIREDAPAPVAASTQIGKELQLDTDRCIGVLIPGYHQRRYVNTSRITVIELV